MDAAEDISQKRSDQMIVDFVCDESREDDESTSPRLMQWPSYKKEQVPKLARTKQNLQTCSIDVLEGSFFNMLE